MMTFGETDKCPCKGCVPPKRCADPNCHATCEEYKAFRRYLDRVNEKKQEIALKTELYYDRR